MEKEKKTVPMPAEKPTPAQVPEDIQKEEAPAFTPRKVPKGEDEPREKLPVEDSGTPLLVYSDEGVPLGGEEAEIPEGYGRRAGKNIRSRLLRLLPAKRDPLGEKVRKCMVLLAVLALIVSGGYMLYDMVLVPTATEQQYKKLAELYDPDAPVEVPEEYADTQFPQGMTNVLKAMYALNHDLRGYLTFTSTASTDWLNIQYPVMAADDNDYYLTHDFYKKKNANGALFFDSYNWITENGGVNVIDPKMDVNIIYGHNNINGQMFSNLVQLTADVKKARQAPTVTLETLYGRTSYRVFAVCMFDEGAKDDYYFNYRRLYFDDQIEFISYISNIRMRSYWNYDNVDVIPGDKLLVLSTCTTESVSKLKEGRIAVFAREIRSHEVIDGEDQIVANPDVVMPYAWYVNNKKTISKYYTDQITGGTTASKKGTTTTTKKGSTTTTAKTTTKTTAKPTASTTKPTTKSTTKPTTASTTKPTTESTATPTTEPTTEPTAKPEESGFGD